MSQPTVEAHPLFLPDDEDDDPVLVSEIQITRYEQGQQVFYPRVFQANELRSLEDITRELGGGQYTLISRHDGRITTRKKVTLPGKPKPMYDEGRQEKETPAAAPAAPVNPMSLMTGEQGIMPLIMLMMQQQNQAADRQTQMFIAMMQGHRESSAEDKAAARAELQANIERERINSERMMTLMKEVSQAGRSGGSFDEFTRGVEFMRGFANQQIEVLKANAKGDGDSLSLENILDTLGQVLQGVELFKGAAQAGGAPSVAAAIPGAATEIPVQ